VSLKFTDVSKELFASIFRLKDQIIQAAKMTKGLSGGLLRPPVLLAVTGLIYPSTMKMEMIPSFEKSANFCQTVLRHIPDLGPNITSRNTFCV
jgi:hypothetical protein